MTQNKVFTMRAPAQISKKRDDIKLLEQGPNVGILYSIIDCGTQFNEYYNKTNRQIRFTFEFPLLKQLFNIDDTELRPTVVSIEMTFQMAERSTLRKFVEGALGKSLSPHEYEKGYDIGQFLGQVMMVNIVNQTSKKAPFKTYNKIASVQAITEHIKSIYVIDWNLIVRHNDLSGFLIDPEGTCFQSEVFSKLPNFLREKIMNCTEAKTYRDNGGVFIAQVDFSKDNGSAVQPAIAQQTVIPVQPQQPLATPSDEKKLVMVAVDFTKEQYYETGWTDESLVADGKAKWVAEQPVAPAPALQVPQVPQAPQVPAGPPTLTPPALTPPVANQPALHVVEQFQNNPVTPQVGFKLGSPTSLNAQGKVPDMRLDEHGVLVDMNLSTDGLDF